MKLDRLKIHRIIRQKQKGVTTGEIALEMKVTCRRVQQIWKHYLETGCEPLIGANLGRPHKPYDEYEAAVIREAHAISWVRGCSKRS